MTHEEFAKRVIPNSMCDEFENPHNFRHRCVEPFAVQTTAFPALLFAAEPLLQRWRLVGISKPHEGATTGIEKNASKASLRNQERSEYMSANVMSAEDPLNTVLGYINAFNKGDAKVMAAHFTNSGSILDGMAPHLWSGPNATEEWYRDVLVEGERHGASDYFVTLGTPLHANVSGDSAYVVSPATMTFKIRGKQVTQSGALFTTALRKSPNGWRIAAWAWAKGTSGT
jgi:ketosteroid isomerase-like protein